MVIWRFFVVYFLMFSRGPIVRVLLFRSATWASWGLVAFLRGFFNGPADNPSTLNPNP